MLTTKKARKVLNKKEQRHLTESGINSMVKMKNQVTFMLETRKKSKKTDPFQLQVGCTDCFAIAVKLGLIKTEASP